MRKRLFIKFIGRKANSIGIHQEFQLNLEIFNDISFEQLKLKLYDLGYEHIIIDKRDIFVENTNCRYFIDLKGVIFNV